MLWMSLSLKLMSVLHIAKRNAQILTTSGGHNQKA